MNIQYYEAKNMPVVMIDDFYDEIAQEKIMQELLFLNNDSKKMNKTIDTGSAIDEHTKKPLKNNKGVFLHDVFVYREYSNILTESSKRFFEENIETHLKEKHKFFYYFSIINLYSTLVSYYEQSDYYRSHTDSAIITAIIWFYKTPKSFSGGNLIIEKDLEIECKKNRMVIFPSILEHEVTEVEMNSGVSDNNFGRFSITHLLTYSPQHKA